jgi:hypothetical protein
MQRDGAALALLAAALAHQRGANRPLQLAVTVTAQAAIAIASQPSTTDRRTRRGFVPVGLCDTCPRQVVPDRCASRGRCPTTLKHGEHLRRTVTVPFGHIAIIQSAAPNVRERP